MIADRITILRDGELVVTDDAAQFDRDKIIRAMVGAAFAASFKQAQGVARARPREKVLSVQNLSMSRMVKNNSFHDLWRPGDRHVRPYRLGPHGDREDHRGRRKARLLLRRRDPAERQVVALPGRARQ